MNKIIQCGCYSASFPDFSKLVQCVREQSSYVAVLETTHGLNNLDFPLARLMACCYCQVGIYSTNKSGTRPESQHSQEGMLSAWMRGQGHILTAVDACLDMHLFSWTVMFLTVTSPATSCDALSPFSMPHHKASNEGNHFTANEVKQWGHAYGIN